MSKSNKDEFTPKIHIKMDVSGKGSSQEMIDEPESEKNLDIISQQLDKPATLGCDKLSKVIQKKTKKRNPTNQSKVALAAQKQAALFQQKVAGILLQLYTPKEAKEYFLCNDVYIEFDLNLNEEESFEKYKQLQNDLRPISCVKFLKESGFLTLEFDCTKRGIDEFSYITRQLRSAQNKDLLSLADNIDIYKDLVAISKQHQSKLAPAEKARKIQKNKLELRQFISETVPNILKSLDPTKFFLFAIYDITEGFHNQTKMQYGMNEKFIQLFGSNVQELTSLQLHEGWFNLLQADFRNRQSIEFFLNVKAIYESHFDYSSAKFDMDYQMLTQDNIRVPVTVKPGHHYCVSSMQKEELFHEEPLLIGLLHTMEIELTPQAKKMIRDVRIGRQQQLKSGSSQELTNLSAISSPIVSQLAIQSSQSISQTIPFMPLKIQPLVHFTPIIEQNTQLLEEKPITQEDITKLEKKVDFTQNQDGTTSTCQYISL